MVGRRYRREVPAGRAGTGLARSYDRAKQDPGARAKIRASKQSVTALNDGSDWQGRPYRSLSTIARGITGTRRNGWVFFALRREPNHEKTRRARPEVPLRGVREPRRRTRWRQWVDSESG